MDDEKRLELIRMIIQDEWWNTILFVGREVLDRHYPAEIFDGSSGDPGPAYIVALRKALSDVHG